MVSDTPICLPCWRLERTVRRIGRGHLLGCSIAVEESNALARELIARGARP